MRYLKGARVEVMNRTDSPLVSWRCAEILAGNGHTYSVRYDDCRSTKTVERVSRKAIRPCPPSVKVVRCWAPGDVVEVFEEGSWKSASVLVAVGGEYILVRVLGSCKEFRVHTSRLRLRQTWQNERWVVIQKNPGNCDDKIINNHPEIGKSIIRMPRPCLDMKKSRGNGRFADAVDAGYDENWPISSRSTKKRSKDDLLLVNARHAASRKMRAVKADGGRQQGIAWHPSYLPKKVDAVASPYNVLGEKYMHTPLDNKATRFYGMDIVQRELNTESESICSSVDSCSVGERPSTPVYYPIAEPLHDSNSPMGEAESYSDTRKKLFLSSEQDLSEEIHHHELNAYRSTMLAFDASGPLTWEKQALLSNLRLMLHISIDEHLLEIRHLISSRNSHHSL